MSNSGSGRSWVDFSDDQDDREPPELLEDPRLAAYDAVNELAWMFPSDIKAVLDKIDEHGLTICWKP